MIGEKISNTASITGGGKLYSKEQIQFINKELNKIAHFFGYTKADNNPYGFYEYEQDGTNNL